MASWSTRSAGGETYLNPAVGARLARQEAARRADDLSPRESDVLRLLASGHTNAEIAAQLHLSVRTVEAHRARLLHKPQLSSRADVVRYARDHGFFDPS